MDARPLALPFRAARALHFAAPLLGATLLVAYLVGPETLHAQEPFDEALIEQPRDSVVYTLDLDCSARGILNEGTNSLYSIVGIAESGSIFPFTREDADMARLTEADCSAGVAPFTVTGTFEGPERLLAIQIELLPGDAADDALYLDWVQLALDGPDLEDFIVWDVDGGLGWCLSADPADRRGDWRGRVHDRRCYPCLQFSLLPVGAGDESIVEGDWRRTARPVYAECYAGDRELDTALPPGDGLR